MTLTTEKMHRSDLSRGETHAPHKPASQLVYNIANMKLGRMELGTAKWWQTICNIMHRLDYPELDHVFSGRLLPPFVSKRLDPEHQTWIRSAKVRPECERAGKALQHNKRISKAIEVLSGGPLGQMGFITVVAEFAGTEAEAIKIAETEAARINRFIRKRFGKAVCLLFPEIDLKLAEDVDAALLPRAGWKLRFEQKQRIFKIHFHGLLYVPDHAPADIEASFKFRKDGKRNKFYSGANQVRVLPVNQAPGFEDGTPDVEGVCGYATKYHYNPPVKSRMLEGFVSWLLVTDEILRNPKSIIVVGVQSGILNKKDVSEVNVQDDADETYISACSDSTPEININDLSKPSSNYFGDIFYSNDSININCVALSGWFQAYKIAKKKLFAIFVEFLFVGRATKKFMKMAQGP